MNWNKGLFRITLIISIIGAIVGGVSGYQDIMSSQYWAVDNLESLQRREFNDLDEQRLIDEWKEPYFDFIPDDKGAELSLEPDQKARWEEWTGMELGKNDDIVSHHLYRFDEIVDDPNKTEENKNIRRNKELENLKKEGWQTVDGEVLPLTPKEVWNIQNQTEIKKAEKQVFENKILLPVSMIVGAFGGFVFVWICYYLIKVSILLARPILSWVFAGFCDDAQKK